MSNSYFDNIDAHIAVATALDETGAFVTDFMVKTLSTVLIDGAVNVTDLAGQIACSSNNYLLSGDGKVFSGLVTTGAGETVEFALIEQKNGKWAAQLPCALVA